MTTEQFVAAAKNAVIKIMEEDYGVIVSFHDMELVWYAHELGYKKCTLYAPALGNYYPEVTYNFRLNELYVDIYQKKLNKCIIGEDFDFEIHE